MVTVALTAEERSAVVAGLDGLAPGCRVLVAMSGGVDSSVVAALLVHLGYDVIGVTLQLYDHGQATRRKGACCAGQDIHDARRVAESLAIPHYVLDYEARFKSAVIDRFADSYLDGETPIPCVACNQTIKFGDLAAMARELGAEAMATGHYIGWRRLADGPALFQAADADRDQSYFLFTTQATDLEFLRFPLGGLAKPVVRRLAQSFGLAVSVKPDSQDICFVPSGRYTDVIERLRPGAAEPGDIVHVDGRCLGRHRGILHYTIGQRRGIGVGSGISGGEPLYVVALDAGTRRVVVGPRACLLTRSIGLKDVNWLGSGSLAAFVSDDGAVHARVRSTQPPRSAILSTRAGRTQVTLHEGEHGVARGQACVLYAGAGPQARVLGGGWIAEAMNEGLSCVRGHVAGEFSGAGIVADA